MIDSNLLLFIFLLESFAPSLILFRHKIEGLNYARGVAVDYVEKKFSTVHVADQSGDAHAPVLGSIQWELQNIVLSGLKLPQSTIDVVPGQGVKLSMYDSPAAAPLPSLFVRASKLTHRDDLDILQYAGFPGDHDGLPLPRASLV